jgi:hypothetical protein
MEAEGVDVLFLAPSADLEYLTGVERQIPNFGEVSYAHGWVTGAFFRPARAPCSSSRACSRASTCARSPRRGRRRNETTTARGSSSASRGSAARTSRRRPRLGRDDLDLGRVSAPSGCDRVALVNELAASRPPRSSKRWARDRPSRTMAA